jgi:glycerol uptake facilitator protein
VGQPSLRAELLAEFIGTFTLVAFGNGVVAMTVLFTPSMPGELAKGDWTNINLAWGLGVMFGIYLAGRISGAHLNPAVTLAFALRRRFPWRKVLPYSLAQTAGAFSAAALVFVNYYPAFQKVDPRLEKTAGVFATFPAFPAAITHSLLDQIVGTALLLLLICAIVDERNQPTAPLAPTLIGLVVVAIGASFGGMHGYAINPARDFGPRLLTVLAGFPNNGLTDGTWYFLVPIFGPLIGGPLGVLVYDYGIGRFLPDTT